MGPIYPIITTKADRNGEQDQMRYEWRHLVVQSARPKCIIAEFNSFAAGSRGEDRGSICGRARRQSLANA